MARQDRLQVEVREFLAIERPDPFIAGRLLAADIVAIVRQFEFRDDAWKGDFLAGFEVGATR